MVLPALILLPLALVLVVLAVRASQPRRLPPAAALAVIGLGVHLAVAAAYGVMTLPFSGNVPFALLSTAALLTGAALVIWASRVPLDDDADDDDRRDPEDPGPGDQPPSSSIDCDALERSLCEREPVPA